MQEKESRNSIIWTLDVICCKFGALQANMLTALSASGCDHMRAHCTKEAQEYLKVLGLEINNLADTLGVNLSTSGDKRAMFDTCYDCEVKQNHEHDTAPLEAVSSRDYLFR